jgi:hypothetical protein
MEWGDEPMHEPQEPLIDAQERRIQELEAEAERLKSLVAHHMIREAVKNAEAELSTLEERCRLLVKFIAAGYQLLGVQPDVQPQRRGRGGMGIHNQIEALMRERGKPLSVKEITESLVAAGLVHGKGANGIIRQAITRQQKFERVSRGAYRLKDKTSDASSAEEEV